MSVTRIALPRHRPYALGSATPHQAHRGDATPGPGAGTPVSCVDGQVVDLPPTVMQRPWSAADRCLEAAYTFIMHQHLKNVPVAERPTMVALFPWGAPYFTRWRSLRWFLALLLPVAGIAASLWSHRHERGLSLFVGLGGIYVAACLFVALFSGMASSNWGTHFRHSEPRQYWLQVAVVGIVYLILCCVGHFV